MSETQVKKNRSSSAGTGQSRFNAPKKADMSNANKLVNRVVKSGFPDSQNEKSAADAPARKPGRPKSQSAAQGNKTARSTQNAANTGKTNTGNMTEAVSRWTDVM